MSQPCCHRRTADHGSLVFDHPYHQVAARHQPPTALLRQKVLAEQGIDRS